MKINNLFEMISINSIKGIGLYSILLIDITSI